MPLVLPLMATSLFCKNDTAVEHHSVDHKEVIIASHLVQISLCCLKNYSKCIKYWANNNKNNAAATFPEALTFQVISRAFSTRDSFCCVYVLWMGTHGDCLWRSDNVWRVLSSQASSSNRPNGKWRRHEDIVISSSGDCSDSEALSTVLYQVSARGCWLFEIDGV